MGEDGSVREADGGQDSAQPGRARPGCSAGQAQQYRQEHVASGRAGVLDVEQLLEPLALPMNGEIP
jgi:hypothetical protein